MILFGATFMSFNGVLIKLLDDANGFQVLFYRSIGLSLFVLVFISLKRKSSIFMVLRTTDFWDLLVGLCLGFAFTSYVFSIFFTSVAYTLFILSSTPIIAALLSWIFLSERPRFVVVVAMILSSFGVAIMVKGAISVDKSWSHSLALVSAMSFAAMLVATRRSLKLDILTGTFWGGAFSGLFGFLSSIFLIKGLTVSLYDLSLMILMGSLAIGLGITLVTLAAPYVPSAEVSILVLLESILGPIWVWIFLKQGILRSEFIGGAIILFSVLLLSVITKIDKKVPT